MDKLCDKCGKLENLCECAEGSNSALIGLLAELKENDETVFMSCPADQADANEERRKLVIVGPQRLVEALEEFLM